MTRRYVVTGRTGQFARALAMRAAQREDLTLIALGRPDLDLADPAKLVAVLVAAKPSLIISAAAYTTVDAAETDAATAHALNAVAPGAIGRAAAVCGVPVIHLSTDYVFDGSKPTAYVEDDPASPVNVYGRSKLDGERALAAATPNHAILRTSWLYSPFGRNFLLTMLALAERQDSIDVVDDQHGNPTSAHDLADAVLSVGDRLLASDRADLRGVFHTAGNGEATWADFAEAILREAALRGRASARVRRVATAPATRPARRPANSRLDCARLADRYGVRLPDWRASCAAVVRDVTGDTVVLGSTDGSVPV